MSGETAQTFGTGIPVVQNNNFFQDCVLVQLKRRAWNGEIVAKIRPEIDEAHRRQLKRRCKVVKKLIDKDDADFNAIVTTQNSFYTWLTGTPMSLGLGRPCGIDGFYLVKKDQVGTVWGTFQSAQKLVSEKVTAYINGYAEKLKKYEEDFVELNADLFTSDMRKYYQIEFNPDEYPSAVMLPHMFGMRMRFIQVDAPQGLPAELQEQQKQEFISFMQEAQQKVVMWIYEKVYNCVKNLADRTASGETLLHCKTATLLNPKTLCKQIRETLNVNDFAGLNEIVNQLEAQLTPVGEIQAIKDNDTLRTAIHSAMDDLTLKIGGCFEKDTGQKFLDI